MTALHGRGRRGLHSSIAGLWAARAQTEINFFLLAVPVCVFLRSRSSQDKISGSRMTLPPMTVVRGAAAPLVRAPTPGPKHVRVSKPLSPSSIGADPLSQGMLRPHTGTSPLHTSPLHTNPLHSLQQVRHTQVPPAPSRRRPTGQTGERQPASRTCGRSPRLAVFSGPATSTQAESERIPTRLAGTQRGLPCIRDPLARFEAPWARPWHCCSRRQRSPRRAPRCPAPRKTACRPHWRASASSTSSRTTTAASSPPRRGPRSRAPRCAASTARRARGRSGAARRSGSRARRTACARCRSPTRRGGGWSAPRTSTRGAGWRRGGWGGAVG